MEMTERIRDLAGKYKEEMIRVRRTLHQNPEITNEEFGTSAFLARELSALGYDVQTGIAGTGVSALLRGEKEGRTLLIRADMDALPVAEDTGLPFSSRNEGKMHACGHDAHMAIVYGAACILKELQKEIRGNIRFVFQPAEEDGEGAKRLIEAGIMENPPVDAAIGTHVWPEIEAGCYGVRTGAVMSAPDFYEITIRGKGGHGAQPEKCIDPIRTGHRIYEELSAIPASVIGPLYPSVVSVTMFAAGTCSNVFPDTCVMKGTVRTYDPGVQDKIQSLMEEIVADAGRRYGADCSLNYRRTNPPLVNDPELAQAAILAVQKMWGEEAVAKTPDPSMIGEDFAYYLEKVPGVFIWTGVRREDTGMTWPLHHPKFAADEDAIWRTAAVIAQFAVDYNNSK